MRKCSMTLLLLLIVIVSGLLLGARSAAACPCAGPGAPMTTQTKGPTAVKIPGHTLKVPDIKGTSSPPAERPVG